MRKMLVAAAVAVLVIGVGQVAWADHDDDPIDDSIEDVARTIGGLVCETPVACFDYDDFEGHVMDVVRFVEQEADSAAPDPISECVADDRGRPFVCAEVSEGDDGETSMRVCVRDPRRGRGLVTGWTCATT